MTEKIEIEGVIATIEKKVSVKNQKYFAIKTIVGEQMNAWESSSGNPGYDSIIAGLFHPNDRVIFTCELSGGYNNIVGIRRGALPEKTPVLSVECQSDVELRLECFAQAIAYCAVVGQIGQVHEKLEISDIIQLAERIQQWVKK